MAHNVEAMDIDDIETDFDNKENAFQHNLLPITSCTEKGYEELDVSELNMKLRYSTTPTSSPMSKSLNTYYVDNKLSQSDNLLLNENGNLTQNAMTRSDITGKASKVAPLQLNTSQLYDKNRNSTVLRPLDTTYTDNNVAITVSGIPDDENVSLPSSSSSLVHTPEATTPTKDIPKQDGGSPIMRGLKSVLNMFRSSQSPIPLMDEKTEKNTISTHNISPDLSNIEQTSRTASASTPVSTQKVKEPNSSKKNSPYKESIVFNDDLEKELEWKDETTIIFSNERIPIHKLYYQKPNLSSPKNPNPCELNENVNDTVEYMDISYNNSAIDKTVTDIKIESNMTMDSDNEFVDCESTFTKNESDLLEKEPILTTLKISEQIPLNNTLDFSEPIISKVDEQQNLDIINSNISVQITLDNFTVVNAELPEKNNIQQNVCNIENEMTQADLNDMKNTLELSHVQEIKGNQTVNQNLNDQTKTFEDFVINNDDTSKIPNQCEHSIEFDSKTLTKEYNDFNILNEENENIKLHNVSKNSDVSNYVSTEIIKVGKVAEDTENKFEADIIHNNEICNTLLENKLPVDVPLPEDDDDIDKIIVSNTISHEDNNVNINFETYDKINNDIQKELTKEKDVPIIRNSPQNYSCQKHDDLNKKNNSITTETDADTNTIEGEQNNMGIEKNSIINLIQNVNEILVPAVNEVNNEEAVVLNNKHKDILVMKTDEPFESLKLNQIPDIVNDTMPTLNIKPEDIVKKSTDEINSEEIFKEHVEEEINTECQKDVKTEDIMKKKVENENKTESELEIISVDIGKANTEKERKIESQKEIKTKDIVTEIIEKESCTESEKKIILEDIVKTNAESHIEIKTDDIVKENIEAECISKSEKETIPNEIVRGNVDEINNTESEKELKSEEIVNENTEKANKTESQKEIKARAEDIVRENTWNESKRESEKINPEDFVEISMDKISKKNNFLEEQLSTPQVPHDQQTEHKSLNEDELVLSESGSPFVSVSVKVANSPETCDELLNRYETKCLPSSPPICSKGYNFNFDETDDLFATKTKIEMSLPPVSTPKSESMTKNVTKNETNKNRRRSQQERKRTINIKSKVNKSFDIGFSSVKTPSQLNCDVENTPIDFKLSQEKPEIDSKINEGAQNISPVCGETNAISPILREIDSSVTKAEVQEIYPACSEIVKTDPQKHDINCRADELESTDTIPLYKEISASTIKATNNGSSINIVDVQNRTSTFCEQGTTSSKEHEIDSVISDFATSNTILVCSEVKDNHDLAGDRDHKSFNHDLNMESKNKETTDAFKDESRIEVVTSTSKTLSAQPIYVTSSVEAMRTKNVFNLPEIDDMNFNPFVTKSKLLESDDSKIVMTSTTPNVELEGNEKAVANTNVNEDNSKKNITLGVEICDKDNINNTTCFSKDVDDKDLTVREVLTEDEETLEGPFLEAEEMLNNDKITKLGSENDMIRFSDVKPPTKKDEELFIDAQAFEFLMNQNANEVADSGKESLFLKFDPLFASKVNSDGIVAALSDLRKKQSTPCKTSKSSYNETFDISAVAASSTFNANNHEINLSTIDDNNDCNMTVSKPMMVVPPALNPVATPRNKATTPTITNRRSMTFASPAIAVIDRLLSMSNNNSFVNHESIVSSQQHEADLALVQLREVLAEKEEQVLYLRIESEELKDKLSNLESQMRTLESESEDRLKKINDLTEKLTEKTKMNKSMASVVEEYERTIASLIAEGEQEKKLHYEEKIKLITERDEQSAHLASMEVSFSDLHSKYEKSKQVILGYKANEETYTKTIKEFEDNFSKMQNNYEMLKQHATSKLNHANQELEKIHRAHDAEVLKLNAMIKRKDLYITSLEETVAQKSKANEELTAICDELINKVG